MLYIVQCVIGKMRRGEYKKIAHPASERCQKEHQNVSTLTLMYAFTHVYSIHMHFNTYTDTRSLIQCEHFSNYGYISVE